MATIKLSEIVGAYLDSNNLGAAEYAKCYAIAIRGWRELNWDIVGTNKQVRLCVECDNTVCLPDDFISATKVGTDNGHGGIMALTRTDNLNKFSCPTTDFEEPSNIRGGLSEPLDGYPTDYSLGVGSYNNIGYFQIENESNRILLAPNYCGGDIILEYLSYTTVTGEYTINELAQNALLWWIRWEYSLGGKSYNTSQQAYNESRYYNEKRKAKLRIKRWMVQDMNQSARQSVKQGIKS